MTDKHFYLKLIWKMGTLIWVSSTSSEFGFVTRLNKLLVLLV